MKKIDSKLFQKFEISKANSQMIKGGTTIALGDLDLGPNDTGGPGGTTNDCTGTGGDCWDADCGTNVVEDATWTGGKESGNDTCN